MGEEYLNDLEKAIKEKENEVNTKKKEVDLKKKEARLDEQLKSFNPKGSSFGNIDMDKVKFWIIASVIAIFGGLIGWRILTKF